MAGRIKTSDIEEVKSRVNIADVVGEYVQLKPSSVGALKGLCPFHDEKSASFNVRPVQGFYHCFGCGEGGDVFKFLQQMDQISFTEAVEKCAAKIGYTLTYEAGTERPENQQRSRVLEANTHAAAFFEEQLMSDEGAVARDFLKGRGFDKQAANHFGVGYAPKSWSSLFDYLTTKGFTAEELIVAGLANRGDKGVYDKFRGRAIWPIRDASSQVIGFGARKLYEDDQGPKYLNTSETPAYHKSSVLYGLDLAKKDISKRQQVVVVEGYTDVMACHLAGVTTAVATCGTAFGDDHIRIINRLLTGSDVPAQVIFTFDPDAAGQKAAMRAFADSNKFSAQTFVAIGPDGLDPSDLRQLKGDAAVVTMIENKRPLFEFAIKTQLAKFDINSIEGRVAAARAAAPIIAGIRDAALRPSYIRELAGWVNLDGNEVSQMVESAAKASRADAVADLRRGNQSPPEATEPMASEVNLNDPINRFERQVLEVLLQAPGAATKDEVRKILDAGFSAAAHAAVGKAMTASFGELHEATWLSQVEANIDSSLVGLLRAIAAQPLPVTDEASLNRYARGVLAKALENTIARQKSDLLAELRRNSDNPVASADIQKKLVELEAERRMLREKAV
jgi:DNA primase